MKNAVRCEIKGLKCDNPDCDYLDMTIKSEDYEKYVNTKCPKCGDVLLTEEAYNSTKLLLNLTDLANKLFAGVDFKEEEKVRVKCKMDRDGKIEFGELE